MTKHPSVCPMDRWSARGSELGLDVPMRSQMRQRALPDGGQRWEVFAFAGLWDTWREPTGSERTTFTILTTQPNALLAPLRNRMPVILQATDYDRWLSNMAAPQTLLPLLTPYPADEMRIYAVSRLVNAPVNDTPAVMAPAPAPPGGLPSSTSVSGGLFSAVLAR